MNPYLIFNGNCAEAFRFYERVLGGRITAMHRRSDTPDGGGPESQRPVMHARLELGACLLMGSDADAGDDRTGPRNIYLAVIVPAGGAERIFRALADGGQITMPFENTFWSPGSGMLIDRFGTPWMVSAEAAS